MDVDQALWPFAEWSVRAQLAYLAERGELPPGMQAPDGLTRPACPCTALRGRYPPRYLARPLPHPLRVDQQHRLGDSWIQPRATKSASALLTVSREAPTSWASSS